jgi:hypothetical protein
MLLRPTVRLLPHFLSCDAMLEEPHEQLYKCLPISCDYVAHALREAEKNVKEVGRFLKHLQLLLTFVNMTVINTAIT